MKHKKEIYEKMKRRDFGESMSDETKLKVLNFIERQLRLYNVSKSFTAEMWRIDTKATLGGDITEKEKQFFNDNFDKMKAETSDDADHWRYHTSKL